MNLIRHIIEPRQLLVTWQSPLEADRLRRMVATVSVTDDGVVEWRYLSSTDEFAKAVSCGFQGYPAFPDMSHVYVDGVMDTLSRRLPPRSRTDFSQYLAQLRLPPDAKISDFGLLGYSGAKLPGDGFGFVHPFQDVDGPCELILEVAGSRHQDGFSTDGLGIGDGVTFEIDPSNAVDPDAIRVMKGDRCLGYVPRGPLPSFNRWLSCGSLVATIDRINGTSERPRIFLFVSVSAAEPRRLAA